MSCPSCGANGSDVISRKYWITALRRCRRCRLLFRTPTDSPGESKDFYENRYESGRTTAIPTADELRELKENAFAGTSKNFRRYVSAVRELGAGAGSRLLDLGCSWGYGAWQFQEAGFRVIGHELSVKRCNYARQRMGVKAVSDLEDIDGQFDVIFSAHVLEHIATLEEILDWSERHLKDSGMFVAVTPNGSAPFRQRAPARWNRLWGDVHPLFLDADYWRDRLRDRPYYISSRMDDFQAMQLWSRDEGGLTQRVGPVDAWELLVAWRHPQSPAAQHVLR